MNLVRIISIAAVVAMSASITPSALSEENEAPASSFATLKFEGACDASNNRLWLSNTHTFKTISVKVRWRAAGGKDLVEDFFPGPNSIREIGCAADAEVLSANFADF